MVILESWADGDWEKDRLDPLFGLGGWLYANGFYPSVPEASTSPSENAKV
jgi:hypothetical protein